MSMGVLGKKKMINMDWREGEFLIRRLTGRTKLTLTFNVSWEYLQYVLESNQEEHGEASSPN